MVATLSFPTTGPPHVKHLTSYRMHCYLTSDRMHCYLTSYRMHCCFISYRMHCYIVSYALLLHIVCIATSYRLSLSYATTFTCHTQLMDLMISCKSYLATCTHLKRAMNEARPQSLLARPCEMQVRCCEMQVTCCDMLKWDADSRPCEMQVRCWLMWDAGEMQMHVTCTLPKYPDQDALFVCPCSSDQNTCILHQIRYHQLLMHTDTEMCKYTDIHRMCILKRTDFQCSVLGEPEHVLVIVIAGVTDSWPIWMLVIMCLPAIVSCNHVVEW